MPIPFQAMLYVAEQQSVVSQTELKVVGTTLLIHP